MSVLIKGMKMPKMPKTYSQGEVVPYIDIRIFADDKAVISKGEKPYFTEYCVIEVPPHGRLIDADALYEKTAEWEAQALHMVEQTMNDEDKSEWHRWSAVLTERSAFKYDVADMPTIIEAEGGEE